jgi:hypothetical protein
MGRWSNKEPVEKRFWRLVDVRSPHECWPWRGAVRDKRKKSAYGAFVVSHEPRVRVASQRFAYELTFGQIPPELFLLRHCENSLCCNPLHWYLSAVRGGVDGQAGESNPNCRWPDGIVRYVVGLVLSGAET